MEVGGRVALSGEEAGKWDEQGRSQAESWIQLEPSLRLVPEAKEESGPSSTHPCAHSLHDHGCLGREQ